MEIIIKSSQYDDDDGGGGGGNHVSITYDCSHVCEFKYSFSLGSNRTWRPWRSRDAVLSINFKCAFGKRSDWLT